MAQPPRREKICCSGVGRMRSVRRQRRTVSLNKIHGRQKLNNETIAFFRDAWDIIRPC